MTLSILLEKTIRNDTVYLVQVNDKFSVRVATNCEGKIDERFSTYSLVEAQKFIKEFSKDENSNTQN